LGNNKSEFRFILLPLIFVAIFFISVVIHELSHTVAAIIMGINPTELKFGWYVLGPGVTVPDTFPLEDLIHFRYAGGLGAGLIFLTAYIVCVLSCESLKKKKWWQSWKWWTVGFILFWSFFQFYNGYVESMRFEEYASGLIDYTIPFMLIFLVANVIHFLIYYRIAKKIGVLR